MHHVTHSVPFAQKVLSSLHLPCPRGQPFKSQLNCNLCHHINPGRWLRWKKNLPAMQETWVWSLGREDPLEKEMAIHSSILAWEIPWTEEPGGLQSTGSQRIRHDWVINIFFLPITLTPMPRISHTPSFLWSLPGTSSITWVTLDYNCFLTLFCFL